MVFVALLLGGEGGDIRPGFVLMTGKKWSGASLLLDDEWLDDEWYETCFVAAWARLGLVDMTA